MHHRDEAIVVAGEQFAAKKLEIRERKAALDAQARFLEDEGVNNKEADARIAFYDREIVSPLMPCSECTPAACILTIAFIHMLRVLNLICITNVTSLLHPGFISASP